MNFHIEDTDDRSRTLGFSGSGISGSGGILDFTNDEIAEAAVEDAEINLSNGDKAVSMGPERGDTYRKLFRTIGDNIVGTYRTKDDEESFMYCGGCGSRQDFGYGWDDRADEKANEHAGECRVASSTGR